MRRIIGLALLIGVFLGGYHLGRQKDSPDLIGYARKAVVAVASVAGDIAESFSNKNAAGDQADRADYGAARADSRAGVDPANDTRAYVNQYYVPQPSHYAPAENQQTTPAQPEGQAVAQTSAKPATDWARRIWQSLQQPKQEN